MKKFDLPFILDILFIFFASLFISFTVLRFYLDGLSYIVTISFLISFLAVFIGLKLLSDKHKNVFLKNEDNTKKKEIFFNLAFFNENDLISYFLLFFNKAEIKAEKTKEGIFLSDKNMLVKFCFKLTPLNSDDFIKSVKITGSKKILLLTDNTNSDVISYAKKTQVKIICGTDLYLLMKKYETYPQIKFSLKANEKIVKKRINIELSRKKAKNFLIFGAVLLLFSMFVAFPIYYLVMGNILIITSFILRFYGKKTENTDTII